MLQSSQDVLYIVLAISSGLLALALVWLLVEAALALHRMNLLARKAHEALEKIEAAISSIRGKVEHSASYFPLFAEGVKQIVRMFSERKQNKKKK